MIDDYFSGLDF